MTFSIVAFVSIGHRTLGLLELSSTIKIYAKLIIFVIVPDKTVDLIYDIVIGVEFFFVFILQLHLDRI